MPTSHVTFDPRDDGVPLWRSPSSTSAAGGHSVDFHTPVTNICNNHNPINHVLFADLHLTSHLHIPPIHITIY